MSNKTTVGQTKKGQFLITFPKAIAEALRIKKKDQLEFIFDKGDVIVRKI